MCFFIKFNYFSNFNLVLTFDRLSHFAYLCYGMDHFSIVHRGRWKGFYNSLVEFIHLLIIQYAQAEIYLLVHFHHLSLINQLIINYFLIIYLNFNSMLLRHKLIQSLIHSSLIPNQLQVNRYTYLFNSYFYLFKNQSNMKSPI